MLEERLRNRSLSHACLCWWYRATGSCFLRGGGGGSFMTGGDGVSVCGFVHLWVGEGVYSC